MAFIALGWPVLPIFDESLRFCYNRVIEHNTGINDFYKIPKYRYCQTWSVLEALLTASVLE